MPNAAELRRALSAALDALQATDERKVAIRPILLRAKDAAALLAVEQTTLYELVRRRTIPPSAVIQIPGIRGMKFDYDELLQLRDRWRVEKAVPRPSR